MKKKKVLSLMITTGSYSQFIDGLVELGTTKKSSYVCVSNVHMLIEAYNDSSFAAIVNNADIATPDGMPLAKGFKSLYGIRQDRVAGMDLLPDLLKICEKNAMNAYFYGGTEAMLDNTSEYCKKHFPKLSISGLFSPPFRPLTLDEENTIINQINAAKPNFIFVALGCPKQEKWMASMKGRINGCMIGIGGALPVMVGMQKRAPGWMQKTSLEWLYRLSQEPKRLFKRYAITNSTFLYLFFKQWAKQGFKPIP